jgi:hypothetical protein
MQEDPWQSPEEEPTEKPENHVEIERIHKDHPPEHQARNHKIRVSKAGIGSQIR